MYSITIDGFSGILTTGDNPFRTKEVQASDVLELALQLLMGGYSVKINALRVSVDWTPGDEHLVWDEGAFAGQALRDTVQSA